MMSIPPWIHEHKPRSPIALRYHVLHVPLAFCFYSSKSSFYFFISPQTSIISSCILTLDYDFASNCNNENWSNPEDNIKCPSSRRSREKKAERN